MNHNQDPPNNPSTLLTKPKTMKKKRVPTPTSKKTKVKKVAKTKTKKTQKTQPTTEDEDEAPKRARSLWTDGEELLLAETYIQVSEDPKEGADQQRDTFWYKVMDVYNKEAKRLKYPNRSKNMITGKWTRMNRDVGKFNTIVCETALMSGENDKDFMERCHMLFKRTWKNDFKHSAAWNFLKDLKKFYWMSSRGVVLKISRRVKRSNYNYAKGELKDEEEVSKAQLGAFFAAMMIRANAFPEPTQWSEGERRAMEAYWPHLIRTLPSDIIFLADPEGSIMRLGNAIGP
ncbi:hypothetical protein Tco_1035304 [Tanacetum coccineum]